MLGGTVLERYQTLFKTMGAAAPRTKKMKEDEEDYVMEGIV